MRSCATCFLVALATASAFAQGGQANKDRVRRAVNEKRDQMRSGDIVLANAKITVRLKNGNKMAGVVKGEQFIERFDALDFVPSNLQSPEAGLRIWYYDSTNSFIFLRYAEITDYKITTRLSDVQVRELEHKVGLEREEAERRRREAMARAEKDKAGEGKVDGATDGKTDDKGEGKPDAKATGKTDEAAQNTSKTAMTAAESQAVKVAEEFPAADGWSEAKAKEIEKRKVVVGTYPSAKEKRFLEVLEQWKQGVEIKKKQAAEKTSAPAR